MSETPSNGIELADAVSNLLYSIAGWLLIGLGIFSTLGAVSGLVRASSAVELFASVLLFGFAITFIASGAFVNPSFRQRLNHRHNLSRFGRIQVVDNRTFDQTEGVEKTCVACDSKVTEGLIRRYREEYAVAGVPIRTLSEDHNYYCTTCGLEETSSPSRAIPDKSLPDRQPETEIE